MEKTPKTFEIGLVMAGAVSAGAYTAGVVDFLIEALDTWDQARTAQTKGTHPGSPVPIHDLKIRVLTGASAGGMTAAIALSELLTRPFMPGGSVPSDRKSLLYKAWVEDIDISKLLRHRDLENNGDIKSLLDSSVIDEIANNMIDENLLATAAQNRWDNIPFVDKELRVYLTLSNLRGLPYEFKLKGETGFPYGMTDHSDYQYIKVWKETPPADWVKLRNAAMATGAFPIGLAPRLIERDLDEYKVRLHKDGRALSGLLKIDTSTNKPYNFVSVDGGTLNNEPIELARSLWIQVDEQTKNNMKSKHDAERAELAQMEKVEEAKCPYALILVDPFPDLADAGEDATAADATMSNIVGPLIGALRAQSLFKIEELIEAGDQEYGNRFLIAPIRKSNTGSLAKNAIASGFFGGFGGFLSKDFRDHDYQLGRRNCQQFLRKYFAVELQQAIAYGWQPVPEYAFDRVVDKGGVSTVVQYYPIVPIIKGTDIDKPQGENNNWPSYPPAKSKQLKTQLGQRIDALLGKVLPFGWVDKKWVVIALMGMMMLVLAGEYVKASRSNCNCIVFQEWFKNTYILFCQIILIVITLVVLILRLAKWMIRGKLTEKTHEMFLKEVKKWGL